MTNQNKKRLKRVAEARIRLNEEKAKKKRVESIQKMQKKKRERGRKGVVRKEIAEARAKLKGKVAVFEKDKDKTITERTPAEVRAIRKIEEEKALKKVKAEPIEKKIADKEIKGETKEMPEKKGFLKKVGGVLKSIDTLGGITPSAVAEREGKTLKTGFIPIGPAGTSKLAATKLDKNILNVLKDIRFKGTPAQRALDREIAATKITHFTGGQISNKAAIRMINSYNKWNKPQLMRFLASKPLKSAAGLYTGFAGVDTITSWYALDNIADGNKFIFPDAQKALDLGVKTAQELQEFFRETDISYDLALKKINATARYNIFFYPAKKLILKGIKDKKAQYDLKKENFIELNNL